MRGRSIQQFRGYGRVQWISWISGMLDSRTNRVFRGGSDVMIVNVTAVGWLCGGVSLSIAQAVRVRFCLATEKVGRMQREQRESEKDLCVVHRLGEPRVHRGRSLSSPTDPTAATHFGVPLLSSAPLSIYRYEWMNSLLVLS
jgi:hypothetical protein